MVVAGGKTAKNNFSVAVLTGWDHGLMTPSAAKLKKQLLKKELEVRTADQKLKKTIEVIEK